MNTVEALKNLYKTMAGKDWPYDPNPTDAEVIDKIAADGSAGGSGGGGSNLPSITISGTKITLEGHYSGNVTKVEGIDLSSIYGQAVQVCATIQTTYDDDPTVHETKCIADLTTGNGSTVYMHVNTLSYDYHNAKVYRYVYLYEIDYETLSVTQSRMWQVSLS